MRVSLSYISHFIEIQESAEKLAGLLTMSGSEVEKIIRYPPLDSKIIIAKIEDITPNSPQDGYYHLTLSDGKKNYSVISSYPGFRKGDIIPLAKDGASLPYGKRVRKTEFAGAISEGIILSTEALGFCEEKGKPLFLRSEHLVGKPLELVARNEDTVFELEITPNRPDCLSHIGIARELQVLLGRQYIYKLQEYKPDYQDSFRIKIENLDDCPRYSCAIIRDIKVDQSPPWLLSLLSRLGIRPINNIVDITNLVMLEMGHPMHAFDLDRLNSDSITVRRAKENERIVTIDGEERPLSPDIMLIATDHPVAIAGIMGGKETEVTEDTKSVLLESAYFNPRVVRKGSKSLGLFTEASARFERGADPEATIRAIKRATELIKDISGGSFSQIFDIYPKKIPQNIVDFDPEEIPKLLGISVPEEKFVPLLEGIGFRMKRRGRTFRVEVPSFRPDVDGSADIVEEIGRLYGLEKIPNDPTISGSAILCGIEDFELTKIVAEQLTGMGFSQIITNSIGKESNYLPFLKDGSLIEIINPISEDFTVMRPSLLPEILKVVSYNLHRQNTNLKLFEIGKTFRKEQGSYIEEKRIAGALVGESIPDFWETTHREFDFFDVKGAVESLALFCNMERFHSLPRDDNVFSICADFIISGKAVGSFGLISRKIRSIFDIESPVFAFELSLSPFVESLRKKKVFKEFSRFPAIRRDVALIVDKDTSAEEILHAIGESEPLVENAYLFDHYTGKGIPSGKKNLAFRITYRSFNGTLTKEQANEVHIRLVESLCKKFNATPRM
ncbi:phenylalanine--tRNA ligase subunit beta [bacterium]|nr:phenylalanine--tRNA ligase subunit beta [bacterium]